MHQRHVERRVAVRLERPLHRLDDPRLRVSEGAATERREENGDVMALRIQPRTHYAQ